MLPASHLLITEQNIILSFPLNHVLLWPYLLCTLPISTFNCINLKQLMHNSDVRITSYIQNGSIVLNMSYDDKIWQISITEWWWRHQMEAFSALLAICVGNSPVPGEFPAQRPVMRSFDVFFDLRLNKRLSKQSWGWWFETLWRPLWCHCNDVKSLAYAYMMICPSWWTCMWFVRLFFYACS